MTAQTAVLLTATITMESRAGIGNRSTPSQKDMKAKEIITVFSNIQVALLWTSFTKARVEIQMSLSYFHFLEQNHVVDNYTW